MDDCKATKYLFLVNDSRYTFLNFDLVFSSPHKVLCGYCVWIRNNKNVEQFEEVKIPYIMLSNDVMKTHLLSLILSIMYSLNVFFKSLPH